MTLTELSIKRPSMVVVIFSVLTLLGLICYSKMNMELLPKFTPPIVNVATVYPGASPSEVESSVTKPIEDAVSTLSGIKRIRSMSQESVSIIILEMENTIDTKEALREAQRKVNEITGTLPNGVKTPVLGALSSDDTPILKYSINTTLSPTETYQLVKDRIKPMLASLDGVGSVDIVGGEERCIRVNVDKNKLQAYNLSLLTVSQAVSTNNLDFPTGKIGSSSEQLRVRLAGKFATLDDIKNLVIARFPSGAQVKLADVAEVIDGTKDMTSINRLNGSVSLGLAIKKQADANAVNVAGTVTKRLQEIEKEFSAQNLTFKETLNTTAFTLDAVHSVEFDLGLAVVLVALTMLIFLHSLRDSFIVMLAIPCSFVATFIAMYLMGFTLNLMTLLSLTLVVGILVDDSIVVLENIHRHLAMGKEPRRAALDGRNEIGFTALAITLVDVIVFLPLALTNAGVISVVLRNFATVIVVATMLSLFVSFTVTPLLASRLSKHQHFDRTTLWGRMNAWVEDRITDLIAVYGGALSWSLRHKFAVFGIAILMFGSAIALVRTGFVGRTFIDLGDRGEFVYYLEFDKSSPIENTARQSRKAEELLLAMPEVKSVLSNVGGSSGREAGGASQNKTELFVKLVGEKERTISTQDFMFKAKDELRQNVEGLKISHANIGITGAVDAPAVQVVVSGSDGESVMRSAKNLQQYIKNVAGTNDVNLSNDGGVPEVKVSLDKEKMASLGLNTAVVGATLRTAYAGNDDSKFRDDNASSSKTSTGAEYDVKIMLDGFDRRAAEDVRNITFLNPAGNLIKLEQFATVEQSVGPAKLERTNRITSIRLDAGVRGRGSSDVAAEIEKTLKTNPTEAGIESGVQKTFIGEYENQQGSFGAIGGAFGIAIVLMYFLLVALYDNYIYPFVVLFAVPPAIMGAFYALSLTRSTLSVFTIMGLVAMMGLVVKNSILIVDFANNLKHEGLSTFDALLQAGKERLRPILMTTLTMILGMLPVAVAKGSGAQWKNGLGWVLVGGLTGSLILTIFLVPVVFLVAASLTDRFQSVFVRKRTKAPIEHSEHSEHSPTEEVLEAA
jgi:hydrophobic/amphiphilic exporter-1 (mainly G- bacteria), HAE1 family